MNLFQRRRVLSSAGRGEGDQAPAGGDAETRNPGVEFPGQEEAQALRMELAELLRRCRRGEPLAWEALVRQFQGRVYALALHYARDREEARDLAQEVFVRVYRKLDAFHGEEPFLPWLLRVARNLCIDQLRRAAARPPAADIPADEARGLRAGGRSPEEEWEAGSRKRLVHRAMATLSGPHREIILLKEIQGLKLEEIADMLGVPLGTVKSRSNRARLELAQAVLRLAPDAGASP